MVNCAVIDCTNRSTRETEKSFFRIPKVVSHQGEKVQELSEERRKKWINNFNTKDFDPELDHYRVCSDHFMEGEYVFFLLA